VIYMAMKKSYQLFLLIMINFSSLGLLRYLCSDIYSYERIHHFDLLLVFVRLIHGQQLYENTSIRILYKLKCVQDGSNLNQPNFTLSLKVYHSKNYYEILGMFWDVRGGGGGGGGGGVGESLGNCLLLSNF
jgi:hypothetical protein